MNRVLLGLLLVPLCGISIACSSDRNQVAVSWSGSIDTLPSGRVVVENPVEPIWREGREWQVVEELRIGSVDGGDAEAFGRVESFDVDTNGRIWVLDGIARELRVFDPSGSHFATIGREGSGPGEFQRPVDVELASDGTMWVVDVGSRTISRFDSAGKYLGRRAIPSGSRMDPWRGGFDRYGNFYTPVPTAPGPGEVVSYTLLRHDEGLNPLDTLRRPRDPVDRRYAEFRGAEVRLPLQGTLRWWLSREGTIWAILTDEYRLFELDWNGDTLRSIGRAFTPVPVTEADSRAIREQWSRYLGDAPLPTWLSQLPSHKPPLTGVAFEDELGNLWVEVEITRTETAQTAFDVFDPDGRYLGPVEFPFRPSGKPIVRNGAIYALMLDSLDVPYIVNARLLRMPDQ